MFCVERVLYMTKASKKLHCESVPESVADSHCWTKESFPHSVPQQEVLIRSISVNLLLWRFSALPVLLKKEV